MARVSITERQKKREKIVAKYAEKRRAMCPARRLFEERLKPIAHSLGAGVALRRLRPYINSRISSPRVSLSIT